MSDSIVTPKPCAMNPRSASPAFLAKLRAQFEGEPGKDYQLSFHLAPPLLASRNADGHLVKKSYGPWMLRAFRLLAGLKSVRGTMLDPFGYTAERRMERQLIENYLSMIDEFCRTLSPRNLATAIQIAQLPEQIRGFDHVKERSVLLATRRRQELLVQYRGDSSKVAAA